MPRQPLPYPYTAGEILYNIHAQNRPTAVAISQRYTRATRSGDRAALAILEHECQRDALSRQLGAPDSYAAFRPPLRAMAGPDGIPDSYASARPAAPVVERGNTAPDGYASGRFALRVAETQGFEPPNGYTAVRKEGRR